MISALQRRQSTIDQAILSPGAVTINVQGAFIAEETQPNASAASEDGAQHDTDIRLPNHKTVVSHIALDASLPTPSGESDATKMALTTHADRWLTS